MKTIGLIIFLCICLSEYLYCKKKGLKSYIPGQSLGHLTNGFGQITINLVLMGPIMGLYYFISENYSLIRPSESNPLSWAMAVLLTDLCYYWGHRTGHRVNIVIGVHNVHHQASDYNLLSAFRLPWFNRLTIIWFFLPLAFFGFSFKMILLGMALNSLVATFSHSGVVKRKLGILESIIVTPRSHYVHHGVNAPYRDKNYGGVFIFWDKLFGTYAEIDANNPVELPLNNDKNQQDPLFANTDYFHKLFFVMKRRTGLLRKLNVLFSSPESIVAELDDYPYKKVQKKKTGVINRPNYALNILILAAIITCMHFLSLQESFSNARGVILFLSIFLGIFLLGQLNVNKGAN